ncbi:MAG: hypothetical protein ACRDJC_11160 [Thermomicrobiales bacterium]
MASEPPPVKRFHHIGLRAIEPQPKENHVTSSKCWVTNPADNPNRIEWLRYAPDSPIDPEFMNFPHIAYTVDELEPHLEGKDVYLSPFEVGDPPFATVAFTRENGVFVEYMKIKPGRTWFNE